MEPSPVKASFTTHTSLLTHLTRTLQEPQLLENLGTKYSS